MDFSHFLNDRTPGPVGGSVSFPDQGQAIGTRPASAKGKRLKLWVISPRFHCSILGTCLTPDDLRKSLAKSGVRGWETATDMEVHSYCVDAAARNGGTSGRLARLLQKILDRRYARAVREVGRMTETSEIRDWWRTALADADVPGPYWAVFSHPASTTALLEEAFGDVHILTHRVVASEWKGIQQLRKAAQERDRLAEACREQQSRIGGLRSECDECRRQIDGMAEHIRTLESAKVSAEEEVARREDLDPVQMARELARVRAELDNRNDRCICLERRISEHKERIGELEHYVGRLRSGLVDALSGVGCEQECPNYPCEDALIDSLELRDGDPADNLRDRTVLFIGGRNRQHRFYRDLVEMLGGKLRHHDGGLEKSAAHLDRMLRGADAIVCQTDCVSHDACKRAKAWAKGQGVPWVMMKRTGSRAFAATLRDLGQQFGASKESRVGNSNRG